MKPRAWLLVPLALVLAAASDAQEIHKCIGDEGVTYQNAPCTGTQAEAGLLRLPGYADPPQRDGAMAPPVEAAPASAQPVDEPFAPEPGAPDGRDAFPFRTSIALGLTDDQVLNLPSWGRPTRIERYGRRAGWRETWTYERDGDVRQLAFVDGRLAQIGAERDALAMADATLVAVANRGAM